MTSCSRCKKAPKIIDLYKAVHEWAPAKFTCQGCGAVHVPNKMWRRIVNYGLILLVLLLFSNGALIATAMVLLVGVASTPWLMKWELEGEEHRKVAKEALKVAEDTFGSDHPAVGKSLNNLASMYLAQGKYAEAEPLYKRALAIDEKAFGKDHPNVTTDLNNLAALYLAQGKYAEAEPLLKREMAIAEKTLGPDHPQGATVLKNMARLYKETGRVDEAKRLEERAQAIRSRNQ